MERFTGNQALVNLQNNPYGLWNQGIHSVKGRLDANNIVYPHTEKKSLIFDDTKIFTIGSCFARELEFALAEKGRPCFNSLEYRRQAELLGDPHCSIGQYGISKYNCFSVLNELRWALEPGYTFPESALIRDPSSGMYYDLHGGGGERIFNGVASREEALEYRQALITNIWAKIRECQVIIITLGVNEVWFDNETGLYVNLTPPGTFSERFSFEVLSYEQNMAALEEIFALLKKHCTCNFHIIVMMGPSPLFATFTSRDVLIANTLSKSMLRTVADAWAAKHEEIDYFPSFEMAMNSPRGIVWTDDAIHLQKDFVHKIIDHLLLSYGCVTNRANSDPIEVQWRRADYSNLPWDYW